MLNHMFKSTQFLFSRFFGYNSSDNQSHIVSTDINSIQNDKPSSSLQIVDDICEKIYFQPNTIYASENTDCKLSNISASEKIMQRIILECNQNTVLQLDKICRYFEIEQNSAIMRGLWMLSLVKEVEINNKKIGVITLDDSGVVVDISPINIV